MNQAILSKKTSSLGRTLAVQDSGDTRFEIRCLPRHDFLADAFDQALAEVDAASACSGPLMIVVSPKKKNVGTVRRTQLVASNLRDELQSSTGADCTLVPGDDGKTLLILKRPSRRGAGHLQRLWSDIWEDV